MRVLIVVDDVVMAAAIVCTFGIFSMQKEILARSRWSCVVCYAIERSESQSGVRSTYPAALYLFLVCSPLRLYSLIPSPSAQIVSMKAN